MTSKDCSTVAIVLFGIYGLVGVRLIGRRLRQYAKSPALVSFHPFRKDSYTVEGQLWFRRRTIFLVSVPFVMLLLLFGVGFLCNYLRTR